MRGLKNYFDFLFIEKLKFEIQVRNYQVRKSSSKLPKWKVTWNLPGRKNMETNLRNSSFSLIKSLSLIEFENNNPLKKLANYQY